MFVKAWPLRGPRAAGWGAYLRDQGIAERSAHQWMADVGYRAAEKLSRRLYNGPGDAAYNDPYLKLQSGFAEIDAGTAQRFTRGGGVRVALIDAGVDTAHPDLQGRIDEQRDFVANAAMPVAADRHGTEVDPPSRDALVSHGVEARRPDSQGHSEEETRGFK